MLVTGCTATTGGTPSSGTVTGSPAAGLNCDRTSAAAATSCLRQSLEAFWSNALQRSIRMTVVLHPRPGLVPAACRSAVRIGTAFTCPTDKTIYVTGPYLRELLHGTPTADGWYRLAATLGHEMGHVVQFAVRERLVVGHGDDDSSRSRRVEQQADCLAGVWAAGVRIDRQHYLAAVRTELQLIDSRFERRTHGPTAARLAAVRHGLAGRTAAACHLVPGK